MAPVARLKTLIPQIDRSCLLAFFILSSITVFIIQFAWQVEVYIQCCDVHIEHKYGDLFFFCYIIFSTGLKIVFIFCLFVTKMCAFFADYWSSFYIFNFIFLNEKCTKYCGWTLRSPLLLWEYFPGLIFLPFWIFWKLTQFLFWNWDIKL